MAEDLKITLTVAVNAQPVEAGLRGIVRMAHEASRQISQQIQRGFSGQPVPPPDFSRFDATVSEVQRGLDEMAQKPPVQAKIDLTDPSGQPAESLVPRAKSIFESIAGNAQQMFFLRNAVSSSINSISTTLGNATAPFIDYEQRIANVNSLLGDGQNAHEMYSEGVLSLVSTTRRSAQDLSEGLYEVVSAFGVANDNLEKLEINAKAAAAGLATTKDSIALTSAVTKGYGDTSAEAIQKVADLAFTAVRLGQTTFPQLAAAMPPVIAQSQALGVSQEELFAVMATGTGVTGNAAAVATQYQSALTALMNPTEELTDLQRRMGFANSEAMIESLGLVGSLQEIAAEANRTGQPLMNFLRRKEGVVLTLALAGAQADEFSEKLGEMGDAAGAMEEAFLRQTDTIAASRQRISNEMELLRINFTNSTSSVVRFATDGVGTMISWLNQANPIIRDTVFGAGLLSSTFFQLGSSGLAPLIAYGPQVLATIRGITAATWHWVAANRALMTTLGVVGIAGVLASLVFSTKTATAAARDTGDAMRDLADDAEEAANKTAQLNDELARLDARELEARIEVQTEEIDEANDKLRDLEHRLALIRSMSPVQLGEEFGEAATHIERLTRMFIDQQQDQVSALQGRLAQMQQQLAARQDQAAARERQSAEARSREQQRAIDHAQRAEQDLADFRRRLNIDLIQDETQQRIAQIDHRAEREAARVRELAELRKAGGHDVAEVERQLQDDLAALERKRVRDVEEVRITQARKEQDELERIWAEETEAYRASLDAMNDAHITSIDVRLQWEERFQQEFERLLEERARMVQRYTDVVLFTLYDAFRDEQRLSDAQVALDRERHREREQMLREQLRNGQIDARRFNLEMAVLADQRAAYDRRVEEERAGFLTSSFERIVDFAIQEGLRLLSAFIARTIAQRVFAAQAAAAAVVTTNTAMRSIMASAAPTAGAVSIATFGAAAASGTAAAITGMATTRAAGMAMTGGFRRGGFTGHGREDEEAGIVHRREVIFEAPIVRGQVQEILAIRAALQRGVKARQLLAASRRPEAGVHDVHATTTTDDKTSTTHAITDVIERVTRSVDQFRNFITNISRSDQVTVRAEIEEPSGAREALIRERLEGVQLQPVERREALIAEVLQAVEIADVGARRARISEVLESARIPEIVDRLSEFTEELSVRRITGVGDRRAAEDREHVVTLRELAAHTLRLNDVLSAAGIPSIESGGMAAATASMTPASATLVQTGDRGRGTEEVVDAINKLERTTDSRLAALDTETASLRTELRDLARRPSRVIVDQREARDVQREGDSHARLTTALRRR